MQLSWEIVTRTEMIEDRSLLTIERMKIVSAGSYFEKIIKKRMKPKWHNKSITKEKNMCRGGSFEPI